MFAPRRGLDGDIAKFLGATGQSFDSSYFGGHLSLFRPAFAGQTLNRLTRVYFFGLFRRFWRIRCFGRIGFDRTCDDGSERKHGEA